jgi:hypothetical protein
MALAVNVDAHSCHPVLKSDKFTVLLWRYLGTLDRETCPMYKEIEHVIAKMVIHLIHSLYCHAKIHKIRKMLGTLSVTISLNEIFFTMLLME